MKTYTVVLSKDEDDPAILNVVVPALPGCYTFGRGKRQTLKHARDAIRLYIESLEAAHEPIPEDAGIERVAE